MLFSFIRGHSPPFRPWDHFLQGDQKALLHGVWCSYARCRRHNSFF